MCDSTVIGVLWCIIVGSALGFFVYERFYRKPKQDNNNKEWHDTYVLKAVNLLEHAIQAIKSGDKYNSEHIKFTDGLPFGKTDMITRFNEPLIRLIAMVENDFPEEKIMEQARDLVGYAALAGVFFLDPTNKTTVANHVRSLYKS